MTKSTNILVSLIAFSISVLFPIECRADGQPVNDNIASAIGLGSDSTAFVEVVNTGATVENDEPLPQNMRQSVWYRWTAPDVRWVVAATFARDCDTVLAAYDNWPTFAKFPYPPQIVAANDDQLSGGGVNSRICFETQAGHTYYFQVGGTCALPFQFGVYPFDAPSLQLADMVLTPLSPTAQEEPQPVQVKLRARGSVPLDSGVFLLTQPTGQLVASYYFDAADRTSGDEFAGEYAFEVTLPAYAPAGFYPTSVELVSWTSGPVQITRYGYMMDKGFPAGSQNMLFVSRGEKVDDSCPDIISFAANPRIVDLAGGAGMLEVSAELWDLAGVRRFAVSLYQPDGAFAGSYELNGSGCTGPRFHGTLRRQITIPAGAPHGLWSTEIYSEDCLGNACVLSAGDFAPSGFRVGNSQSPNEDTDGDCVGNLLERAFGMDPLTPDHRFLSTSAPAPGLPLIQPLISESGASITYSWIRNTNLPGVRYIPQFSHELQFWKDLPTHDAVITPIGGGLEILTIQSPLLTDGRAFGRVMVIQD